ncbi:MAG: cupin domain-containing protein [Pseudomonadales bacterium]|nr:cupin domain-containing protein [Gammaproteobacteria bacterium]
MWQVFQVHEEARKLKDGPVEYREFLRVPALNCGIYRLKAGSKDMQGSHDDDEVYYVLEGRARLKVGDKDHLVEPGSVLYVSATSEHSFFEIDEDMTLLVFFATSPPAS